MRAKKPKGDGKLRMYQLQHRYDGEWMTGDRLYKRQRDAVGWCTSDRYKGKEEDLDNVRLVVYILEPAEIVPGRILAGKGKMVRLKGKPDVV